MSWAGALSAWSGAISRRNWAMSRKNKIKYIKLTHPRAAAVRVSARVPPSVRPKEIYPKGTSEVDARRSEALQTDSRGNWEPSSSRLFSLRPTCSSLCQRALSFPPFSSLRRCRIVLCCVCALCNSAARLRLTISLSLTPSRFLLSRAALYFYFAFFFLPLSLSAPLRLRSASTQKTSTCTLNREPFPIVVYFSCS